MDKDFNFSVQVPDANVQQHTLNEDIKLLIERTEIISSNDPPSTVIVSESFWNTLVETLGEDHPVLAYVKKVVKL